MSSIQSPFELFGTLYKKITGNQKLAFLSAFCAGLLCHLFIITNSMSNNDDIRNLYVTLDKPALGRWLLTYFAGISSYFSLPVVNCVLAVFFIALSAMVIVAIFDLQNRVNIFFISVLLAVFPSVATIFAFTFTADPYMMCLFLSCLAAYFVTRVDGKKWYWIIAALFLMLSVAIYQAYLPFTLLLMILWYILMLLQTEKYDNKTLIRTGLRYIYMLVCGMGAYFIGMKLTLKIKGTELKDYQGISDSSIPGPSELLERIKLAFVDFRDFFRPSQVLCFNRWMQIAMVLTLLALLFFFMTWVLSEKIYLSPLRIGLLSFCILCIPLSTNVMLLISSEVQYHMLMRHAWCILFMAPFIIYEAYKEKFPAKKEILFAEWGLVIAIFLVTWNYVLLDNIAYFNMNFRYEKTYAHCIELREQIKAMEDYDRHLRLAFVGSYSKIFKTEGVEDLLEPMTGMKGAKVTSTTRLYIPFFQNYLGEDVEGVTPEEELALKENPTFIDMPVYPDAGSIRIIDDVIVVKLNKD